MFNVKPPAQLTTKGDIKSVESPLVRVQTQSILQDTLGIDELGKNWSIRDSLKRIADEGSGLFVLINYKDAKSYWLNKLEEKEIEPKSNRRVIGVGSQILRALDLKKMGSRNNVDKALQSTFEDPSFRAFLLKNLQRVNKEDFAFKIDLDIILSNLNEIEKALPSNLIYNGETLFIKGEKSDYINDSNRQIIINQFPNSKTIEVPNAGHWVHAENLNDFVKETLLFLKY